MCLYRKKGGFKRNKRTQRWQTFGIHCQFLLLDVTGQAHLEEMNPESECDGPDGKVGKVPSVIHTALTCC